MVESCLHDAGVKSQSQCKEIVKLQETGNIPPARTLPFREKWKNSVYREKLLYSMILSASSLASGMYIGQHGPTFPDIQLITNTDLEEASAFFTVGNAGMMAGCLITGLIYNKMSMPLLLFFTSLCLGGTNMALPHCTQYELMVLIRLVSAVFMGAVATGTNTQHLSVWGPDGNELLHLLHFGFSIGGMVSPLFAEPFLQEKISEQQNTTTISTHNLQFNTSGSQHASESRVEYVFYITGIFTIITAIPYLFVYFNQRQKQEKIVSDGNRKFSQRNAPFRIMIFMLVVYCMFIFTWNSTEPTFFAFLMTFLVEQYSDVSKSKGAFITAIVWGTYAFTRFLLIFLTRKFTPVQLMLFMSTTILVSFSAFTIFSYVGMLDALVVFAAISSVMMAGMFPVGLSLVETEFFQVTGIVGSCILVSNSLGATLNPMLLGTLMEQFSNMWFCYLLLIQIILAYFILISLVVFSRFYVDKKYGSLAMTSRTQEITIQHGRNITDTDEQTNFL